MKCIPKSKYHICFDRSLPAIRISAIKSSDNEFQPEEITFDGDGFCIGSCDDGHADEEDIDNLLGQDVVDMIYNMWESNKC